ncbi:MAG: beta-glucosidase BglX [Saprospiraceae bacterium]|nr:beta-glucosidase BglX [Saprospiraceae bacterium]MCF8250467.1 beta-glucosidase BglX [Saprospiraceae bacterium]MCF8282755.1 beta-glucosidase BglX [Bacteroidales bacterium]MCF8312387.1 beta-glucosidase BglX [Saprospiraceae bacterium]MCF8440616.1 beta-glucosidase BglX [Saprospiraceae bacterium]
MKRTYATLLCLCFFAAQWVTAQDAKMKSHIDGLMKKMTVEEKIGQLNLVVTGYVPTGTSVSSDTERKIKGGQVGGMFGAHDPVRMKAIQDIAMKNSRLKIPLFFGLDVIHGHRTIFPIPLGLSATWDMKLIEQYARIAAQEATAEGLNWTFSPMVDIARDPRWGRISEGNGEDPYLGSQIAKAMVHGYQGDDLSKNNSLMACVKHYALYGAAEAGRDYNTVDMSRSAMYNYYLPPYKAAVDAGVGSIMTSFNVVDEVPASGNRWLMTDLLRTQWGFKGFVVTDYTAINEMSAHGLGDLQTVSALALKAGVDMDMVGEGFLTTLKKSLNEGKVKMAEIDLACRRILEAKWKMGLFEDAYRRLDASRPAKEIMTPENRKAAREIAAHSFVLLKNEHQVLPLAKTGKTVAFVGPFADNHRDMLGTWVIGGEWEKSVSVKEGVMNVAPQLATLWAKGANITDDTSFIHRLNFFNQPRVTLDPISPETLLRNALETSAKADIIVAVLGESESMTGESSSRTDIGIPESQRILLEELVKTGKPVVLVLFTGRPLTLEWEAAHCAAILNVWAPGTEAGNAIADVLFGDVNPSGKLTATFPRSVGQIPLYYNHKPTGRPYMGSYQTKFQSNYLDSSNDPLFPFGFGMGYSPFVYEEMQPLTASAKGNARLGFSVKVSNVGKYAGEEVVQLYITDPVASISRPVKELKGFQKVMLKPGESKVVSFTVSTDDLKFYDNNLKYDWEAGEFKIGIGGNSRDVKEVVVRWDK